MGLILWLIRASRRAAAMAALAGAVAGGAGMALIAVIRAELSREGAPSPTLAWSFAALCLAAAASRVLAQAAMIRLGRATAAHLGVRIAEATLALPLERFERVDRGALVAALTEDVAIIGDALVAFPMICINLPIVVACLAYVGWLAPAALACGVGFAVPAVIGYVALARRGRRHLDAARAGQDALVGHLGDMLDGFRELKQDRRRRAALVADALTPAAEAVRDRSAAGLTQFALAAGWGQLGYFGFVGFLLFALPGLARVGRPELAGVALAIVYVMSPMDVLLNWLPALGRAGASLAKIRALMPALEAQADLEPDGPVAAPTFRESIRLDSVVHSYWSDPAGVGFVLGPVDLEVRRGEVVILAGGNGSGKTTLVKILAGLYEPDSGAISVDGETIEGVDREAYRQLFSVVYADGHLFRTLPPGSLEGFDDRARAALARLGLDGVAKVERGAFSTLALSVGQRKRLALVSAWMEDRPVLVLDEWAANQDPEARAFFYREFLPALRAEGKAVLVISHDEDFYGAADRVLRLRDGAITEERPRAIDPDRPRAPNRHTRPAAGTFA